MYLIENKKSLSSYLNILQNVKYMYLQVIPQRKLVIIVTMANPLPPMTGTMTIIKATALYGPKEAGGTMAVKIAV